MPAILRRRIGWALIALLVVGVICALGATALSSRGLTGELSHVWKQLTATDSHVSDSAAGRVFQFGSSRPVYWHQAIDVGEHALFKGVGLLGFADARLRYTTSGSVVSEAHGYLFETFADLGLLGVVVTLGLLVSWLVAAWRPLALRTRTASLHPEQVRRASGHGRAGVDRDRVRGPVDARLDLVLLRPDRSRCCSAPAGWPAADH